jgi:hypothetical protein
MRVFVTIELIMLLASGCVGFWLGTRWAEVRRARYDMDRVWRSRRAWRKREQ